MVPCLQSAARMRLPIVVSLAALAACGVEPSEDRRNDGTGKMSSNGLVLHPLALARLSAAPLDGPDAAALAATPEGAALVAYAARCALPPGETLAIGDELVVGGLGLAPAWAHARCDDACQRWVTACLLAHANTTPDGVAIWVRADHPAIGAAPGDDAFAYQEAAYFGDLFAEPGEAPEAYVCVGRGLVADLPAGEVVQVEATIEELVHGRLCIFGDDCGITPAGLCGAYLPDAPPACARDAGDGGAFAGCRGGLVATSEGRDDDAGPRYAEVITVYLEE